MPVNTYRDKIYPFQDKILKTIENLKVDFYLTGGTALSRCYLQHRYSDDLDLFVNDHPGFKDQCKKLIVACKQKWHVEIPMSSASFVRLFLEENDMTVKIDFVNDVPYHRGPLERCSIFHKVDNWRNILSNKLCAISRLEAKDLADIVCIAKNYRFEWEEIINEAREKDLWVDPLEICRLLNTFPLHLLKDIKWIQEIKTSEMKSLIDVLHDDIFQGKTNSMAI